MDYLRYYLNCVIQLVGIAGFVLGGQWVWLGIATLPPLLVADALSPQDYAPRRITRPWLADVVIYVQSALVVALYVAFAWRMHAGFDLGPAATAAAWLGAGLTLVWLNLIPNVGSAHELMHRHNPLAKWLGKLCFTIIGAPNRDISHVATHHLYFDTLRDYDTARRGESVYAFVPRCIWGNTKDEYAFEKKRLAASGRSVWGFHSHILWSVVLTAALLASLYAAGGWPALLILAAVMMVSRVLGEALNYLQHFGLVRVPGKPIEARHTWNHLSAVTRVLGLEITNHVNHHQDPDAPYYALVPHPEGPQMRNILLWGIAAFFPPLWNRVIQPKLRAWDLDHADAEERALAAQANAAAGWPDWFGTPPQAAPVAAR